MHAVAADRSSVNDEPRGRAGRHACSSVALVGSWLLDDSGGHAHACTIIGASSAYHGAGWHGMARASGREAAERRER